MSPEFLGLQPLPPSSKRVVGCLQIFLIVTLLPPSFTYKDLCDYIGPTRKIYTLAKSLLPYNWKKQKQAVVKKERFLKPLLYPGWLRSQRPAMLRREGLKCPFHCDVSRLSSSPRRLSQEEFQTIDNKPK
ncbi:uncharacterized protein [Macaca nemestrina]|uniref:uncharacterized protein n=1 Tax=Macaca nemestrina TaxID=9545 RepID=UPI0039B8BE1D